MVIESSQPFLKNETNPDYPAIYRNAAKKRKRLELEQESEPIVVYSQDGQSEVVGAIRNCDLSVSIKMGNFFRNICETKLSRRVINPLMTVAGETLILLDVSTEGTEVNLFVFSMLGYEGQVPVTNCTTEKLLSEPHQVQGLLRLEVKRGQIVIFYNVNGQSRGHLVTFEDDLPEVEFLGSCPSEVRGLYRLHGADNTFLCVCDSSLVIWDLKKGKYLSKPFSLPPSPSVITGVVLESNLLVFVNYDGKSVLSLSVFEDKELQVKRSFYIGRHDYRTLALVEVENDVLTFLTVSEVFHLNLKTSQLHSEYADHAAVIMHQT